jgi:hypothetical protein
MVYWRVPTAYSTASVQDQFDAHQYPTSTPAPHVSTKRACLSLSDGFATVYPPRRHRGDAVEQSLSIRA